MVCLDSDIIINFLRGDKDTINFIKKLRDKGGLSTTSINSFELLKGIPKSAEMDRSKVLEFLNNFKIYNFEFDSSKKAAEIFENLKSKGKMIDLSDILIASIAITNNQTLATKNTKHFKRIDELKLNNI